MKSELPRKRLSRVRGFIDKLYGHDLHAKPAESLAANADGVTPEKSRAIRLSKPSTSSVGRSRKFAGKRRAWTTAAFRCAGRRHAG